MTKSQALTAAFRRADAEHEDIWIVYEAGEWETASNFDLDTFYCGNRQIEGPFDPKPRSDS